MADITEIKVVDGDIEVTKSSVEVLKLDDLDADIANLTSELARLAAAVADQTTTYDEIFTVLNARLKMREAAVALGAIGLGEK